MIQNAIRERQMKRIIILATLLFLVAFSIGASSFHFILDPLEFHPDIAGGYVPTFITAGFERRTFHENTGDQTVLRFIGGGGYGQRTVWQDAAGSVMIPGNPAVTPYTYDVVQLLWNLGISRGFGEFEITQEDAVSLYLNYEGRFESAVPTFNTTAVLTGEKRGDFFNELAAGTVYPELAGNRQFLSTAIAAGFTVDMMVDQQVTQYGVSTDVSLRWAPSFLNNALDGRADYLEFAVNAIGAYPVYHLSNEANLNILSLTLVDRLRFSYVLGNAVPVFVQGRNALGSLIRGFAWSTFNTELTLANNFDIRVAAPEPFWDGIFPRLNMFFDAGYYSGRHFNSTDSSSGFIASTGAEVTLSVFDYLDFGYYLAYLINGMNYRAELDSDPVNQIIAGAMFFLRF